MKRMALILAIGLVATACGGTDQIAENLTEQIIEAETGGDIDVSTGDDGEVSISIEGEDGSGSATFGGDLPDGFPFPLPDDYTVGGSMSFEDDSGTSYTVSIQVDGDDYDAVKAMYESWLDSEGFKVDVIDVSGDQGKGCFMTAQRDDVTAAVSMTQSVVANDDAGNETIATTVSLSWAPNG